ncbi:MAG: NAD(P)(+) transhydrogenase (Re/Si-specific) subunit beta, partial [Ignavibacteria bacterium]|nr:NAD(P)(+) transhydrogenase (Re/Si-specific) subunit beta [Ignavibacteria bacterium]
MGKEILILIYLLASLSFIFGLKMLSHPETARKGNLIAAGGMALAIFGTIFLYGNIKNHVWIFAGLFIGSIIGTIAARKVKMTAMPQMVSLFNGMGGACAAVISIAEYQKHNFISGDKVQIAIMIAGMLIGSVSFSGSMIAFGKLNGNIGDKVFPFQKLINTLILIASLSMGMYVVFQGSSTGIIYLAAFAALVYGIMFVMPIGGADMPVVISLLNSFTGVAAAFGGFLYNNQVMLTGGIL